MWTTMFWQIVEQRLDSDSAIDIVEFAATDLVKKSVTFTRWFIKFHSVSTMVTEFTQQSGLL